MAETTRKKKTNNVAEVVNIALAELYPFPEQPFTVRDDESMQETAASIKEYGVLTPAIARPREGGGYEIISGHRRKRACELAGLDKMPVIVKDMDADTAVIMMVDSNLQRENILPSEKAKAYKMKLEAIKRQGARTDLTSRQVVGKLESSDIVGETTGESGRQIQRYIRLTELEPELQQLVDDKKIGFTPAVELSYLQPEEQKQLLEAIDSEQATPSLSQAQRMKKMSQAGELSGDKILEIMQEEKKPEQNRKEEVTPDKESVSFSTEKLRKYFPRSYTPLQMENTIIRLLEAWQKKRQRAQER
jgi:ParB family chromosome partitioning protein